MPEDDARIFGEAYELWNKWRWQEIHDNKWIEFAQDLGTFASRNNWKDNPLTDRLTSALFDAIGDLYVNGKRPMIPDYFGRSDL